MTGPFRERWGRTYCRQRDLHSVSTISFDPHRSPHSQTLLPSSWVEYPDVEFVHRRWIEFPAVCVWTCRETATLELAVLELVETPGALATSIQLTCW